MIDHDRFAEQFARSVEAVHAEPPIQEITVALHCAHHPTAERMGVPDDVPANSPVLQCTFPGCTTRVEVEFLDG